jgi:Txe/YoeB family toxin of Txe-Axe toxin-antitoxin module
VAEPWLIQFFQRHIEDDPARLVPTIGFLDRLPDKITAEIQAILEAVAAAPPPSFSGGGKWEAMHEDMAGFYEVRVQGGSANHRLICLLERNADDLGGPSIICLDGLSKPARSAASPRDYRRVRQYAAEFRKHRTVYGEPEQ